MKIPPPKERLTWLLMALTLMLMVFGQAAAKQGAAYGTLLNIFVLLGYTALFIRGIIWILVLKRLPLSAAYPFISLSFVLVLAVSHWVFGEEITFFKGVGSLFIITGIILTSAGNSQIARQEEGD